MTPLAACRRVITRARLWTPMWTVLALVAGALVVTSLADPPDRVVAQEIDGRTWLSVPRGTDTALVLANGVSGLVEAEADLADAVPDDLRFGGSDGRFTVLASNGAAVVVADGTHAATVVELDEDAASVLGGGGLLTASTDVSVRTIAADGTIGEPAVVGDTGTPVAGVAPVVDGDGDTWVLTDDDRAARITTDGSVGDRVDVDSSATELLVVDGRAYARSDEALVELGGDRRRPGAGARGVVPSVATETDGRWAVASGRQITLDDDPDDIVSAPDDVRSLAVWFGHVWSATDDVAFAVDDGSVQPVDGVDGPFQLFADGGRLWFVGADGAIAIDRDQRATVFRLAGVDLSLCAGDCSPEAAVDFLDEITTTTAPRSDDDATTTVPPPGITLPPVVPTTSTTTTAPPSPPSTDEPPETTPSPSSTIAPAPAPITVPATSVVATTVAQPTTLPATLPATLPPIPPITEPLDPPNPPGPTPTRPPPPQTTVPPPPAGGGGVILAFADGGGPMTGSSTTVQVGFDGTTDQCIGNGGVVVGGATIGILTWSGAGDGSRSVTVAPGSAGSESIDVAPGELSVTFSVCNLSASTGRTVQPEIGAEPVVSDISISGAPVAGQIFTASVAFSYGAGWSVGNASWRATGACSPGGPETGPDGSSVTVAAGQAGSCDISVVVSFVARDGTPAEDRSSTGVDVAPTPTAPTTSGPPTTTAPPTTAPPTTAAPTTTGPPTTTTATTIRRPPTTTAPPTTAPPTTAAPTTTTPPTTTTTTTTTVPG